jgi:hypothetical protein
MKYSKQARRDERADELAGAQQIRHAASGMRTGALVGVTMGVLGAAASVGGCSSPPPDPPALSCVTIDPTCQPLHDPVTYTTLFTTLFQPTCAIAGTCHAPPNPQLGLSFQDQAESYQLLLGSKGGRARVVPANPGCSVLIERLEAPDPNLRMPPGMGLSDAQICDVVKWLVAGAPNN